MVIDRQRGACGLLMDPAVCAAPSIPNLGALSLLVSHRAGAIERPVTRRKSSAKAALRCRSCAT